MKGKLLIVDDDPNIVHLLMDWYSACGYETFAVTDGDEALVEFRKQHPDIVLLDLHMPRMDGLAVLREIKEIDANAGVIIMTGDVKAARARLTLKEGACDFITKPLNLDYLDTSIEANLLVRQQHAH